MKNCILVFSLVVGMNMFAGKSDQQWNEAVKCNSNKFTYNRPSIDKLGKKPKIFLGNRRKRAHYPKDRTQKKDKRRSKGSL